MDYEIIGFPESRLSVIDLGKIGITKHAMYCLLEIDVTVPREKLRQLRRQGKRISFTAWMTKTIGRCIADHPLVHALAFRKKSVIAFKDVDISIMVEKEIGGVPAPLPLLVKGTNRKTAEEIDAEISAAVSQPISDERDFVLGKHTISRWLFKLYYKMPHLLRVFAIKRLTANPFRTQALSGTVTLTTVTGVGSPGWIIPTRSWHNAIFALGSVSKKPWVSGNEVRIRDILNMTVAFNHDVIDGNQARRFVQDLVRRLEKAADLT
jgi:pyruvate/2-oxoglutarate dehydrogenase complex dihydrolipoamide acyltransferase (E2) component